MKKDFVCQEDFGHKLLGVLSMFVVGRELCLLRVEVLHLLCACRFVEEVCINRMNHDKFLDNLSVTL